MERGEYIILVPVSNELRSKPSPLTKRTVERRKIRANSNLSKLEPVPSGQKNPEVVSNATEKKERKKENK